MSNLSRSDTLSRCAICARPFEAHTTSGYKRKTCGKACSDKLRATHTGRRPTNYKGVVTTSAGYVYVNSPGHPNATSGGRVAQHRLVVEKVLGRYLHKTERVHHKNGVRSDNRPANLEVWVAGTKDPTGARAADLWSEIERRTRCVPAEHMNKVRRAFEEVFGFGDRNA